jgi:hypothetical protein
MFATSSRTSTPISLAAKVSKHYPYLTRHQVPRAYRFSPTAFLLLRSTVSVDRFVFIEKTHQPKPGS